MNNCIVNRSKAKTRQYFVDNLSAILITYMIFVVHLTYFCHIDGLVFKVANYLFYFFMSWFFFKSGMFYKEKTEKDVLKSTFRRLIVPYITFNIVGIVVLALEKYQSGGALSITSLTKEVLVTIFLNEAVYPNLALWFLLSLFIVRNAFNILRKLNVKTLAVLLVSLACLFTIYYLCYYRWAGYDNIPYTFAWGGACVEEHTAFVWKYLLWDGLVLSWIFVEEYTIFQVCSNRQWNRVSHTYIHSYRY